MTRFEETIWTQTFVLEMKEQKDFLAKHGKSDVDAETMDTLVRSAVATADDVVGKLRVYVERTGKLHQDETLEMERRLRGAS